MRFRSIEPDEPEINLIPFIDVLLVVLIFLMLSTTYHNFTEMQLRLPSADTEALKDRPAELLVSISRDGRYSLNRQPLDIRPDVNGQGRSNTARPVELLAQQLQQLGKGQKDVVVVISADAASSHQSVITVMEAARRAGLAHLTFATQSTAQAVPPATR